LHAQHLQTLCHPSNLLGSLLSSMTDLSWLTIEVTEDALISQSSNVKKSLKMLVDLGVKVAIDDFGVGYSNFLYLTELNAISTVKLDRTLLKRIEQDEMKRHKIEALVKMLKQFGFETVAEGIETSAHFKAITGLKLDVLQGFFLNKPMMASMLAKTFETNTQN
jgi:two-component system CheB/CheR fusion protein